MACLDLVDRDSYGCVGLDWAGVSWRAGWLGPISVGEARLSGKAEVTDQLTELGGWRG